MLRYIFKFTFLLFVGLPVVQAHDTWIETGAGSVRVGEYTYVDLMLGNHGNNHRDFKMASKITLDPCAICVIDPKGNTHDLKPAIIDMGHEKEGFWTAKYVFAQPGLHRFVHTLDTLHRTTRAIKSAKTFVIATVEGEEEFESPSKDTCHGFGLELVLKTPLNIIRAGQPIDLQVMQFGNPMADARVTFVPRGSTLEGDFDSNYERKSNADGYVRFVPKEGNVLFAVVHHRAEDEAGEGYENTHYTAAMVIQVPNAGRSN